MHNLHGGTVIGYTTILVLNGTAFIFSKHIGVTILTVLFLGIMFFSTLFAIGTLVRFFRNKHVHDVAIAKDDARDSKQKASTFRLDKHETLVTSN